MAKQKDMQSSFLTKTLKTAKNHHQQQQNGGTYQKAYITSKDKEAA